jgi:glycosyltransferase involved in cell wall biosynthesis
LPFIAWRDDYMRVLLYEQFHSGHYYHCHHHILPRLIGLVDEVVVAVTPLGRSSSEFKSLLEPFADSVHIDDSVPMVNPQMAMGDRFQMYANLCAAVDRVRPDYVLVPTADGQTTAMGLSRLMGRGRLPHKARGQAGVHFGLGPAKVTAKDHAKDFFYETTWRLSTWEKIHVNNMSLYEAIQSRGGSLARRTELMAHPIPPSPRLGKTESRRALGIPEDGRYIGLVAEIDRRKAIHQLLAAFKAGTNQPSDRLLLAGRLSTQFADLIDSDYADMVKEGRIILMNRFIGLQEADQVHCALDIVCTPYPKFGHLSSALLHGVAAGCPILANDFGWPRDLVKRFQLGWLCDVLDQEAFTRSLREAFDRCKDYTESEATKRLLAFHTPDNFAEAWLVPIREEMGRPAPSPFLSWEWVLKGLDKTHTMIA